MYLRSLFLASSLCLAVGCAASSADTASENAAEVVQTATVHFATGSWDPSVSGTVRAGNMVNVDYDFGRLPQCRNQNRVTSWVIEINYRFDGGPTTTIALDGSPGAPETLSQGGIGVPPNAKKLEMWFENRAVGGYDHCDAFDSRYGANYVFDVQQ